jgi:hypothetical protein
VLTRVGPVEGLLQKAGENRFWNANLERILGLVLGQDCPPRGLDRAENPHIKRLELVRAVWWKTNVGNVVPPAFSVMYLNQIY